MKTPEEILDECTINRFDETDKNTFIKAMKIYANQKLDEAAKKAEYFVSNESNGFETWEVFSTNKESILQLKDKIE